MDKNRIEATARVMKALSRLLAQRDVLQVRLADGTAPIVVALPDDAVGAVNARVTESGGCANVVIADRDGFSIWTWDVDGMEAMEAIDVHEDSTVGMLRAWLVQHPEQEASVNLLTRSLPASAAAAKELAYPF